MVLQFYWYDNGFGHYQPGEVGRVEYLDGEWRYFWL